MAMGRLNIDVSVRLHEITRTFLSQRPKVMACVTHAFGQPKGPFENDARWLNVSNSARWTNASNDAAWPDTSTRFGT